MTLTLVSLFDGIGGFPLAFGRAGARTVATVEIDKDAAKVACRHFPDAAQFSDVTKVTADDLTAVGFVPDRGILTAGWPCQDFSVAGRRAGLAGARSGLWWEVVRLLADLRPRWFVGENVPGLLSSVCQCPGDGICGLNGWDGECTWGSPHDVPRGSCRGGCMETHGGAMGAVLGSLAELGYGVAYRVLDAQHFGVPQQRRRVVIIGHLGAPFGAAAHVLLEPESGGGDSAAGREAGSDVAAFDQAVARFREVQNKYADQGACDTEPRAEFADIICAIAAGEEPKVPQRAHFSATGSGPAWQLFSGDPKSYFAGRELTRAAERVVKLATAADATRLANNEGWFW